MYFFIYIFIEPFVSFCLYNFSLTKMTKMKIPWTDARPFGLFTNVQMQFKPCILLINESWTFCLQYADKEQNRRREQVTSDKGFCWFNIYSSNPSISCKHLAKHCFSLSLSNHLIVVVAYCLLSVPHLVPQAPFLQPVQTL